jgi:hypothetical protein
VHLLEGGLQRLGSRFHRVYRRMTGRLGCDPSVLSRGPGRLPGFPQAFPLLTHNLERLTMLIADLARFLGQPSELFGLIPGSLSRILFRGPVGLGLSWLVRHIRSSLTLS